MPIRFQYVSFRDIDTHLTEENRARAWTHRELVDASASTTNLTGAVSNNAIFGMANMLAILAGLQGEPSMLAFRAFDDALDCLVRK